MLTTKVHTGNKGLSGSSCVGYGYFLARKAPRAILLNRPRVRRRRTRKSPHRRHPRSEKNPNPRAFRQAKSGEIYGI